MEKTSAMMPLTPMAMISATRYAVEIHEPSSSDEPIAPEISFSDELVI